MKKYFILLTLCLLACAISAQIIVNESFEEGNTDMSAPSGWICDDEGWVCGYQEKDRNRIPHSGDWYVFASYNTDKWMYKQIEAEANTYYRISFWHITYGIGIFNFEIKSGNSASPSAMTTTVLPQTSINNEDYEYKTITFLNESAGPLFIGFHSMADNSPWYLTLDDIIIEQTNMYNFTLEPLTPDTSVYFGEYGYFRMNLTNTGAETENVTFSSAAGDLDATFFVDGNRVTSYEIAVGETVLVTAKSQIPLNGISNNDVLTLNIEVASANTTHIENTIFNVTTLQPITEFPLMEGFEGTTFPPFGWQAHITNGNYNFERATNGEQPICSPHNGSQAMTLYKSFSASAGKSAILVSPKITLNSTDNVVRFWMYRTDNIDNRADLINIYFSQTPETTSAELLGTIHRVITMEPVEDHNDWFEYSYTFNSDQDFGFIIFEAVSEYGWNMYLDDIYINTSTIDNAAPVIVTIDGTQEYANTDMEISLRVYDESEMPHEIIGTYTLSGNSTPFTLNRSDKGNNDYTGIIPAQSNHTSGTVNFELSDMLGNSATSDTYEISWDWQAPYLKEGFEGEQFPPEGWTREGQQSTWMQWACWGTVYYEDSDAIEWIVTPPEGNKQACLEWDFQENPQDEHLMSPLIEITRPSVLTFETFCHYGQVWDDRFNVRILNTQMGTWDVVWEAADLPLWVNQYEEPVSIDLSDYVGRNIRIDWRGYNTQGTNLWYSWFIDNVVVIPTDTTGVSVPEMNTDFTVYPNPVKDNIIIKSSENIQTVSIYNVCSQKIKVIKLNDTQIKLDISELKSGVYMIETISNHKKSTKKIIKQ